jgi:hypothetical protein
VCIHNFQPELGYEIFQIAVDPLHSTAIWCEKPVNGIKTVFGVLFEVPGLFSILHTTEVSG